MDYASLRLHSEKEGSATMILHAPRPAAMIELAMRILNEKGSRRPKGRSPMRSYSDRRMSPVSRCGALDWSRLTEPIVASRGDSAFYRTNFSKSLMAAGCLCLLLAPARAQSSRLPNIAARWNDAALHGVRDAKMGAPMAARALAIVDTCMYDAWAAYDERAVGTQLRGALRRPLAERTGLTRIRQLATRLTERLAMYFLSIRILHIRR